MNGNVTSKNLASEYCSALHRLLRRTSNPKLGLDRISELLRLVGFEREKMHIIQVVGTNGKGSTVAFTESILVQNGISCGLFTSPHLCTARERIRINGKMVSEEQFAKAADYVLMQSQKMVEEASFFECILAMALYLFQMEAIQVAILEAGLGGRLDATTATRADMVGISSIDFDHQNILGPTISDIAWEKVGAAVYCRKVVSVAQGEEARAVIERASVQYGFDLVTAKTCNWPLGLFGEHQKTNAGLAISLIEEMHLPVTPEKIASGLCLVNWPGRFELIGGHVVLDGAHNPSGVLVLIDSLKNHPSFADRPLVVVYGSLAGPNATHKIEVLLKNGLDIRHIFLHEPQNERALAASALRVMFSDLGFNALQLSEFKNWHDVERCAKKISASIVVCGSLYTVGEIRAQLLSIAMDPEMPTF
jgi:dihydrofolate synthase/folylpolyglutamate synthase